MKHRVAIVTIAKHEHPYIREWIDAHVTLGVSKFYIFDNGSQRDQPLAQFLEGDDRCVVIPFKGQYMQMLAYSHFLANIMPSAPEDWFAFIDCDEFICPVTHATIPDFLDEHGHLGAIGLQWRMFSADGHVRPPESGGVVRNYTSSLPNRHIKTLAHRSKLGGPATGIHNVCNTCRDLDGHLIDGPFCSGDMTDTIRLNHYFTKSWIEFMGKIERGRADNNQTRTLADHIDDLCAFDAVRDTVLAEKLGLEPVAAPWDHMRDELAEVHAVTGVRIPEITFAYRDNPRQAVFAARAAETYHIVEGSVNDGQIAFLTEFVRTRRISSVLEIGFNGGLSAATFLGARQQLRMVSVDLGAWEYVARAKELVDARFPDRHVLHIGDSTQIVPTLPRDALVDLAFVDGGHEDPVPLADLENVLPLVRDGGWVIMDDYCPAYGSKGVIAAWDDVVRRGLVRQVGVFASGDRGWAVGVKM